jgi:hypothetical protein
MMTFWQLYELVSDDEGLCLLLGKHKTASDHLLYGAHACLVPVNYATANVFRQLFDKSTAVRIRRSCDYRNLMLLLPFLLSYLFRNEVEEHNRRRSGRPVIVLHTQHPLLFW